MLKPGTKVKAHNDMDRMYFADPLIGVVTGEMWHGMHWIEGEDGAGYYRELDLEVID